MTEIPLMRELAVIAGIGVLVSVVLARLRLPTVAGLLLAGALVGPHALGLVVDTHAIEVLAEMGVVLLLFSIGLEFSLARLRVIAKQLAVGGSIRYISLTGVGRVSEHDASAAVSAAIDAVATRRFMAGSAAAASGARRTAGSTGSAWRPRRGRAGCR